MIDTHYTNEKLSRIYDIENGWAEDSDFYLSLVENQPKPIDILDIGCGTGLICNAYAKLGHKVTGLDPAISMLEVARSKEFGDKIEWIEGTGQSFEIAQKFDLIIMSGHAFQVLLNDDDVSLLFKNISKHLSKNGHFIFETRNPQINWEERWNHEYTINHENEKITIQRKVLSKHNNFVEFDTHYIFPEEEIISNSKLNFLSLQKVEKLLNAQSLKVNKVFGSWDKSSFSPEKSLEIIFSVSHL